MLPEVTRKVRPPRALSVPFPLGFPLGAPLAPDRQRAVLEQLLALCALTEVPALVPLRTVAG